MSAPQTTPAQRACWRVTAQTLWHHIMTGGVFSPQDALTIAYDVWEAHAPEQGDLLARFRSAPNAAVQEAVWEELRLYGQHRRAQVCGTCTAASPPSQRHQGVVATRYPCTAHWAVCFAVILIEVVHRQEYEHLSLLPSLLSLHLAALDQEERRSATTTPQDEHPQETSGQAPMRWH